MKTKYSVLRSALCVLALAVTSVLAIATSQAGSQVGFRDQPVLTPQTNAVGVNRHGADDPPNHDKGDDHGRHHGPGHR